MIYLSDTSFWKRYNSMWLGGVLFQFHTHLFWLDAWTISVFNLQMSVSVNLDWRFGESKPTYLQLLQFTVLSAIRTGYTGAISYNVIDLFSHLMELLSFTCNVLGIGILISEVSISISTVTDSCLTRRPIFFYRYEIDGYYLFVYRWKLLLDLRRLLNTLMSIW